MNRLIVLGNGFDLHCGLHTSFPSFYKSLEDKITAPLGLQTNCNFILYLIYQSFKNTERDVRELFQNILSIQSYSDWLDVELLLKNFLTGKCFDIANEAFHTGTNLDESVNIFTLLYEYFHNRNLTSDQRSNFEFFVNSELLEFEKKLAKYIKEEQMSNDEYKEKAENLFRKLCGENDTCTVITFNYTTFVPKNRPCRVVHVHGSIDDDIIIGVDKTYIDAKEPTIDKYGEITDKSIFTKTRRILSYTSLGQKRINALPKKVQAITFYGHSLGEQDYSYFQSIFDYYNLYDGNVVLHFCFSEYDDTIPEHEADRTATRVFKLIEKYGQTLDNKDHGKNLLHKLLLENRLTIEQID